MARLTGGRAFYVRRVNTGNYEHKEFSAELAWSADDGDGDAAIERIGQKAGDWVIGQVHGRLGLGEPERRGPGRPPKNAAPPVIDDDVEGIKARVADRLRSEGKHVPEPSDPLAAPAAESSIDPFVDVPNTLPDAALSSTALDVLLAAAPIEISNDALQAIAGRAVQEIGESPPVKVRGIVSKYAPQLAAIPPDRRQAFLDEVQALVNNHVFAEFVKSVLV